jgi:polyamine oxidase
MLFHSIDRAMQILQLLYGTGIPQPIDVFRTSWSSDPSFLMSYSDWPVHFTRNDYALMCAPVNGQVFISGEACSPDFFGYTHGGYFEGIRAAEEVLEVC